MLKAYAQLRRITCMMLLLSLISVFPAAAEGKPHVSLDELRAEVGGGWHEVLTAHGRTIEIDVDANDILLPDVQTMPVALVTNLPFPDESTLSGYDKVTYNSIYSMSALKGEPSLDFYDGRKMCLNPDTFRNMYPATGIDWSFKAEQNTLTVEDALTITRQHLIALFGEEIADSFCIENVQVSGCAYLGQEDQYTTRIDFPGNIGRYFFSFIQSVNNIPIYSTPGAVFEYLRGEPKRDSFYANASSSIKTKDDFHVGGGPVKWIRNAYEDVPLSSFDALKESMRSLIQEGRLRGIETMRLGYMLFLDPEDDSVNWTIPIWVCDAEFYNDEEDEGYIDTDEETQEEYLVPKRQRIFFYGQTGAFLDPTDSNRLRKVRPNIVAW